MCALKLGGGGGGGAFYVRCSEQCIQQCEECVTHGTGLAQRSFGEGLGPQHKDIDAPCAVFRRTRFGSVFGTLLRLAFLRSTKSPTWMIVTDENHRFLPFPRLLTSPPRLWKTDTTHTHTHTFIYIYVYFHTSPPPPPHTHLRRWEISNPTMAYSTMQLTADEGNDFVWAGKRQGTLQVM